MISKYDASGYATKNDLICTDGRTIRKDAFKEQDGMTVPLVWKHLHESPDNILGHAILENREDGVYSYLRFNSTPSGQNAKMLVEHGDITFLSIYANGLIEKSKSVLHGAIREISLVVAGANPGAKIDYLAFGHEDGSDVDISDDQAYITTNIPIDLLEPESAKVTEPVKTTEEVVAHADELVKTTEEVVHADGTAGKTVKEIFDSYTDEQKNVAYILVDAAVNASNDVVNSDNADNSLSQSDEGEGKIMKRNVFDKGTATAEDDRPSLTHEDFATITKLAMKGGSLKEAFFAHAQSLGYGIDDLDLLFPDAKSVDANPAMIQRKMAWVSDVINGTFHTPFSRIRSFAADLTADAARAKGYVRGARKTEEVIKVLRRITTPTTIYKKQKLDRDDVIDIVDLDIVAWLKAEMRIMLDEEIARAVLIGDGRDVASPDKVNEDHIRPIYTDDEIYVERVQLAEEADGEDMIEGVIVANESYAGSGNPVMFVAPHYLSTMLMLKDTTGRRLYATKAELETVLMVSKIVSVPVMANVSRTTEDSPAVTYDLVAIIVNLKDYTIGADKGGQVSMFDNFDIDYNQLKYLIETRISGALTMPKSAIVVEQVAAAG